MPFASCAPGGAPSATPETNTIPSIAASAETLLHAELFAEKDRRKQDHDRRLHVKKTHRRHRHGGAVISFKKEDQSTPMIAPERMSSASCFFDLFHPVMLYRDEDQQKHAAEAARGKTQAAPTKTGYSAGRSRSCRNQHRAAQGSIGLAVFFHDPVSLLFFFRRSERQLRHGDHENGKHQKIRRKDRKAERAAQQAEERRRERRADVRARHLYADDRAGAFRPEVRGCGWMMQG